MFDDVTIARFWSKVAKGGDEECWPWIGPCNHARGGYGLFFSRHKHYPPHRVAYQLVVGPIPEGLVIDHLCRNPPCVNPAHLEPVTQAENIKRGIMGQRRSETAKLITHCKHGHEFTEENTSRTPGYRRCRECTRRLSRESKKRRWSTVTEDERRAINQERARKRRLASQAAALTCPDHS